MKAAAAALLSVVFWQAKPIDQRPVFLTLDDEPIVEHPEAFWNGYPSKKWQGLEKAVEERLNKVRADRVRASVEVLEELRFIGRAHARENVATKTTNGHLSKYSGYVSDRAATLYGWAPTEWVRPGAGFTEGYRVADNGGATKEMTAEGWVDRGWMTSPPHREAMLDEALRFAGMGLGGSKEYMVAHLVFAGMPKATYEKLQRLAPLYAQLAAAKKADVKADLEAIVDQAEGSSFIRIAPLLRDPEREVRIQAAIALKHLQELVPGAKGPIFALVDWGITGDQAEAAVESAKALKAITGQNLTTAKAWAEWWTANWKTWRSPKLPPPPPDPKAPPAPAALIRDQEISKRLNAIASWKIEKGQWSEEKPVAAQGKAPVGARTSEPIGFRGSGDSSLRLAEPLPADFRLDFTLNVVEGMRPRMYFGGFFLGNEGFEKHLFVYGDKARELQGGRIPYSNDRPIAIRADFWGETFAFYVDGKLCATGKRTAGADGTHLVFRAGDDWSRGACAFMNFMVYRKP